MIKKYLYKDLIWVDVEFPNNEEIRSLAEEYNIHLVTGNELLSPSLKSKIDLQDGYIYLILHFPAFKQTHAYRQDQEIDFIIGEKFIITVRYDTVDSLHKYSKTFEMNSVLDQDEIGDHAGFLFYQMAKKIYDSIIYELDFVEESLKRIEEEVFKGREKEMVKEISKVNRNIIDLTQTLRPHKEILESLEIVGKKFFNEDFTHYLKSITTEYKKINNAIEGNKDSLKELRETNDSLLSSKQNETMKILTIMAFVTFPLSLFASIFGMNTVATPIVGNSFDFWIIIGTMGIATTLMFGFFKYKKWL